MVPLNPVEEAFLALADALRDFYPDGEGLTEEQQIKALTYLAAFAEVLELEIPE